MEGLLDSSLLSDLLRRVACHLLLVAPLLSLGNGMVVISTDRATYTPDLDGYAEMTNSSLKGYDEFSLCGRVMTYQFRKHLNSDNPAFISVGNLNLLAAYIVSNLSDTDNVGPRWQPKNVFGRFETGENSVFKSSVFYKPWKPGVWTSFCIAVREGFI